MTALRTDSARQLAEAIMSGSPHGWWPAVRGVVHRVARRGASQVPRGSGRLMKTLSTADAGRLLPCAFLPYFALRYVHIDLGKRQKSMYTGTAHAHLLD